MKRKVLISLVVIFLSYFLYSNFFSENMMIGAYVNQNKNNKSSNVDTPKELDTLFIMANNKFKNSFWGNGTYSLSYTLSGTKINFEYSYEFGKARFRSTINRSLFGNPKITLNKDLDYYYKKIQ